MTSFRLFLSAFLGMLVVDASAQYNTLYGRVVDSAGKPVAGVLVTARLYKSVYALTDTAGKWKMIQLTGRVVPRAGGPTNLLGNLRFEEGRLSWIHETSDLRGRRMGLHHPIGTRKESDAEEQATRSLAAYDSLVLTPPRGVRVCLPLESGVRGDVGTTVIDTRWNPWNPSVAYGEIKDSRDGKTYRTVRIGSQTWLAQNLDFRVDSSWFLKNHPDSGAQYGRLYTWASAMGLDDSCNRQICVVGAEVPLRGVCPVGWRLPSLTESQALVRFAGGEWTGLERLMSASSWGVQVALPAGISATTASIAPVKAPGNDLGLTLLPGRARLPGGGFEGVYGFGMFPRAGAHFWTYSQAKPDSAGILDVPAAYYPLQNRQDKRWGLSVRCIQED